MRGKFITIEGGEGCGKTTQSARLRDYVASSGRECILVREPGGTALGEKIRPLLKDKSDEPPCDRSELLLFLAARAQLVKRVIRPALERGAWVVSDRFSDSTFAYQGCGRGLPAAFLAEANAFACEDLKPDLTILLDMPPEKAFRRVRERAAGEGLAADRIESAGLPFHERLRNGFLKAAHAEPGRFAVIDASPGVEEVWSEICESMKRLN